MIKNRISTLTSYIYMLIRRDIRTKGAILLVAIILWFSINLERTFETTINVPIKVTNLKRNRVLLNPIPKYATVMVKGKGKVLFFSDLTSSIFFELDLANIANKKNFKIDRSNFINQSSLDISLITVQNPQTVEIELDNYASKKIPVILRSFYTLKSGYLPSGKTRIDPESVFVSGPAEKVRKIDRVYSEEMIDSNLTKNLKYSARLLLPDTLALEYSHREVKVFQKIAKKGTNSFKCLVKLLNAPTNKEIITDPVSVTVEVNGPVDELYTIDQKNFDITADYLQLNEFDKTIQIEVKTEIPIEWQVSSQFIKIIEL